MILLLHQTSIQPQPLFQPSSAPRLLAPQRLVQLYLKPVHTVASLTLKITAHLNQTVTDHTLSLTLWLRSLPIQPFPLLRTRHRLRRDMLIPSRTCKRPLLPILTLVCTLFRHTTSLVARNGVTTLPSALPSTSMPSVIQL